MQPRWATPGHPAAGGARLSPDDSWRLEYYRDGPKKKERLYFAG